MMLKAHTIFRSAILAIGAALILAACGGGGGAGGASGSGIDAEAPWVAPTGSATTVTGVVRYERVGQFDGGALDYDSITPMPIRGATVQLIYNGRPMVTTQSNASGQYTLTAVPAGNVYSIRVKAELKEPNGQWDVTVRDNTSDGAIYAVDSLNFSVSSTGAMFDLVAGSGWEGTALSGRYALARSAAPFAILDTIYESQQKVLSAQADIVFPRLAVFWSVKNSTATSDFARGDIGGSFFIALRDANDEITSRSIYILGFEDNDTDEYDSSVIAHEWGHYYQSAFSRDDSVGGRHFIGDDRLDRRVAFSEGWGNAWSGMATGKTSYSDSDGFKQGSGFAFSLAGGHNSFDGPKGWFRELSIAKVLLGLHDQVGFAGVHQALTSEGFRQGSALTDIHSFAHAYRTAADTTTTTTIVLNDLLVSEDISITLDAFGTSESNDGGNTATLPYYRQITATGDPVTLSPDESLCATADNADRQNSNVPSDNDRNKHGYFVYARFTPALGLRQFKVSTAVSGVDVHFQVFKNGKRLLAAKSGTDAVQTFSLDVTADEHILVIHDYNKVWNAQARNVCYTVSIQ
jgi:hypothetical protein